MTRRQLRGVAIVQAHVCSPARVFVRRVAPAETYTGGDRYALTLLPQKYWSHACAKGRRVEEGNGK